MKIERIVFSSLDTGDRWPPSVLLNVISPFQDKEFKLRSDIIA